ncbi:MAG TPA: hypothetical protein VEJ20_04535 [Candidatus Eremiobacteraceae bacterium]|nr:hypothetical protein [Candidatus Eremiobacteraceae bacterium]
MGGRDRQDALDARDERNEENRSEADAAGRPQEGRARIGGCTEGEEATEKEKAALAQAARFLAYYYTDSDSDFEDLGRAEVALAAVLWLMRGENALKGFGKSTLAFVRLALETFPHLSEERA